MANKDIDEAIARKYLPPGIISTSLTRTNSPASTPASTPAPTLAPSTPSTVKMVPTLPPGAQKAKGMDVYISGFHGVYPIEVGVAYWYRGHYLYSTARIPVEPIPFATKKGVHIVGTTIDTAPLLRPGGMPGDRYEYEVAALQRSMIHTWEEQEKDAKEEETEADAFGAQTEEIKGLIPTVKEANTEAYYNDRAMFLAQSAPGSHHGTPTPSRSNTPMLRTSRATSPVPFRAVSSTSRIQALLDQGPIIEGLLTLQEQHPGLLNPRAVNAYLSTMSNAGTQPPSQVHSPAPSGLFMAEGSTKVPSGGSSRNASIHKDIPGPSIVDLINAREKTASRVSRPRKDSMKAASIALNAAFNDYNKDGSEYETTTSVGSLLKCCVHGGGCDGVTVTNDHLTLQNKKGRGFREDYLVVTNQGRTMIDWFAIMKEERAVQK